METPMKEQEFDFSNQTYEILELHKYIGLFDKDDQLLILNYVLGADDPDRPFMYRPYSEIIEALNRCKRKLSEFKAAGHTLEDVPSIYRGVKFK